MACPYPEPSHFCHYANCLGTSAHLIALCDTDVSGIKVCIVFMNPCVVWRPTGLVQHPIGTKFDVPFFLAQPHWK